MNQGVLEKHVMGLLLTYTTKSRGGFPRFEITLLPEVTLRGSGAEMEQRPW